VGEVASGAIKRIEYRGARRARGLGERQPPRLSLRRPRPRVARPAGEHEAVHDERVLPPREQLGKPHLAAPVRLLEAVVLGNGPARRQPTPLCGDALDRSPELDLGVEQPITFAAVFAGLARKAGFGVYGQRD
jgi:hypothetical protein